MQRFKVLKRGIGFNGEGFAAQKQGPREYAPGRVGRGIKRGELLCLCIGTGEFEAMMDRVEVSDSMDGRHSHWQSGESKLTFHLEVHWAGLWRRL